jgi:hypothetical protein
MLASAIPAKFPIPFANGAGGGFINTIPTASQIGVTPGAASLTDGLVPLNFQPVASGGIPPRGQDFNGLFKQITQWNQWQATGGSIKFDAAFAAAIGGYPQGAILTSSINYSDRWLSIVDNNTVDPDSFGQNSWAPDPASVAPGTPIPSFSSTVPVAYVAANAGTIGNAASNAGFAHSSMLLLYRHQWLNFSNALCPVFTSAGVATTRGASPDADFAANKQLGVIDMRGAALIGVDTMGGAPTTRLAGVPVTFGSTTQPTSTIGENLHALTVTENGPHAHASTLTDPQHTHVMTGQVGSAQVAGQTGGGFTGVQTPVANSAALASTGITITNASSGSGAGHNTVPLSKAVNWNLKA